MGHIRLDSFHLGNCVWTPNAYRLVAQKVLLFQMLEQTSISTLPEQSPSLPKMSKRCFVCQYEHGCLSLHFKI